MPAPLRVASYNLHAGVDGWGRPTSVVDAAVGLDADVLFLQEAWRGETTDLAAEIAARSGAVACTYPLATGHRVTGGVGEASWQPRDSLLHGNHGLYLDSELPVTGAAARRLAAASGVERGEWCVSVVSRLPVLAHEAVELRHLARDRARRRLVVVTLEHPSGVLLAFGLHGAHLSHGSIGQYRELTGDLDALSPITQPAILGGDLNCWGPVARAVLRGWRQAARGRTWPSWRPHSQLDHLFVRGPLDVLDGRALDRRESDHRPVVATVAVRSDEPIR